MTPRIYTAAEAQALLDALSAPRGRHSLNCHTHRDCDGCRDDDRRDSLRLHNTEILARTVIAQASQIATLRTAYDTDLAGLRAEVRRADDERAAWRDLRDAVQEYLDARHNGLVALLAYLDADPADAAARVTASACEARVTATRTRLAALVGGAP